MSALKVVLLVLQYFGVAAAGVLAALAASGVLGGPSSATGPRPAPAVQSVPAAPAPFTPLRDLPH